MLDIILLSIGLVGLFIAVYSDYKTTIIPDYSNYGMIFLGLTIITIDSLNNSNLSNIVTVLTILAIMFMLGNLMYYTRQWGGGDAKLLMGLSVVFFKYPASLLNIFTPKLDEFYFPLTILINILIVGAFYSIAFTIFKGIKHKSEFKNEFKLYLTKTKQARIKILLLSIVIFLTSFLFQSNLSKLTIIIIAISIIFLLYFWIYLKSVEKSCMYKKTKVNNLIEGDWLIRDIYKNKKLILKIPKYGITKKQIIMLKAKNIPNVEIKQGIIFAPSFLIATIISLILGNIVNYVI